MSKPKILFFDLETCPDPREIYRRIPTIGAWPGRTFKADIQTIISFGYKFEGDKRARIINAWDFPNWKKNRNDDSALLRAACKIINTADQIVGHNSRRFDWKVLQTRLAANSLPALSIINHVDTMVVAKNKLSLYSNSLDSVSKFLGVADEKMHIQNKWDLWVKIAYKEETKKDLKLMADYCKMDVEVLQQVYDKLRPHHTNAISQQPFYKDLVCPSCASDELIGNGFRMTTKGRVHRLRCNSCGTSLTVDAKGKGKKI
jgi:DNA polymerase elongation subunit (family B)